MSMMRNRERFIYGGILRNIFDENGGQGVSSIP